MSTETITAREILDALTPEALGSDVESYCEQTGGGTATIYVGSPDQETGRFLVVMGPGTYDWDNAGASTFWLTDGGFCVGPDDDGEADPAFPSSLDGIVAAARRTLHGEDPRPDVWDPRTEPAACAQCGSETPAFRTQEPRPSGVGFMVRCDSGHVTVGMPRKGHPALTSAS